MSARPLTAFPEVNDTLRDMCEAVRRTLGDDFTGFYVYGSLANGDFDPATSDIDVVVVTERQPDAADFEKLRAMHATLFDTGRKWLQETELFYMPRADMRRYDPQHPPRIRLHEGILTDSFWQGGDWVLHRHVLRTQGIIVAGPHPSLLVDAVSARDIHLAVRHGILENWWEKKALHNTGRLHEDRYQAHAVLTMCRALYTLHTGRLASKRNCAIWAQKHCDDAQRQLIARALQWRPGMDMARFDETVAFIKDTLRAARSLPAPPPPRSPQAVRRPSI